ncbi:MAG: hypothetical protein ACXU8S_02220 [Phenylobacterium sp.]
MDSRPVATCIALALSSVPANGAFAGDELHRAIYSSLCTEAESGDASGYQVVMDKSASPPSISFDWSEGGLMEPVRASNVAYDRQSGVVRFSADANGRAVSFKGRISNGQLAGILTWIDNPGDPPLRERVRMKMVRRLDLQPPCR